MRRIVAVMAFVACAALAVLLGACDPRQDYRYYHEGIGTVVYDSAIVATSEAQDVYLNALCEQSGLQRAAYVEGQYSCLPTVRPLDWTLIVQSGLNDIDQRCDAYLAWLDDQRRSKEPILNELHVANVATGNIMGLAGAGVKAINIVGLAFGFTSDTFMNVQSRLLLEVDKSTVQTVVLNNQNRYRNDLLGQPPIDNRATAIYVLRSYLRICTPFTIETQINTTVTLFERGAGAAAEARPLIDPRIVRSTVIHSATEPITVVKRTIIQSDTRFGAYEQSPAMSPKHISDIQKALCVKIAAPTLDGDLGPKGSGTRAAIAAYLVARGEKPSAVVNHRVDDIIGDAIDKFPNCPAPFTSAADVGKSLGPWSTPQAH